MWADTQTQYRAQRDGNAFRVFRSEAPVKDPGAGEILVRVKAASLNRRDMLIISGQYPIVVDADSFVPLSDGAGEVVAVGSGVSRFRSGDRVAASFYPNWKSGRQTQNDVASPLGGGGVGMLSEYVTLDEQAFVSIPPSLSYQAAATLPCAGVTAWNALIALGQVRRDEYVLIQGTGGVSLFALQLSVAAGAKPIVISSSDEKLERVRALGAVATSNYRTVPEWAATVGEITGGRGADQIVEVGGAGTLAQSFAALARGGHIAIVGGLSGFPQQLPAMTALTRAVRISGVSVGSREHFEALNGCIEEHGITPIIDSVFAFGEVEAALSRLSSPDLFGKVVIAL
jgi:NADPH:quinone reductase-like Zn-dependent oxidoreductase